MNLSPVNIALAGVLGLLGVGFYGLLVCRNLIKIVVTLQILVKAAVLGLIIAGDVSNQINLAQSMAITVIVADTVVAVIGVALAVQVKRHLGTLDILDLSSLRG
ncbi:MAG: NADH-quinone oxidoreductase subunit K [Chloroflexota bacterium]|nr:NADH-quinone oxidoreductase subunit K [Chloroflexota bacterium]